MNICSSRLSALVAGAAYVLCVGAGMLIDRGLVVRGRHLDRRNRKKG